MRKLWFVLVLGCGGCGATAATHPAMSLRRVILYQNGIGYFERTGHVTGQTMQLGFARGELDDVLKTLTVIDRLGAGVATVDVPTDPRGDTIELGVRLASGRVHDVTVSYAVPTPTWKAAYRVVLGDEHAGEHAGPSGLLQAWAMVDNTSQDDWSGVHLTLATGAPMSFALDLHTPEYVKRPDATGRMVAPTVTTPIGPETVNGLEDRDGDGIPDAEDKCPDLPADAGDLDGCPAPGQLVVTTSSSIVVLEPILFARGSDAIAATSGPILDAIAATLAGNPEILLLEIGGFATVNETDVWELAMRRASAVRAALIARGVVATRLHATTYGATRSLGHGDDADRRVELIIAKRADDAGAKPRSAYWRDELGVRPTSPDAATMATGAHAATRPADVAGAVRYELSEPISIKRGGSSMISILDKPIDATDVYLWRPDAGAPGSDRHPYRAVRLANTSGFTLEPGPVAIFARGTFVGDSLLSRLGVGETAWIPYAIDGSTTVTVTTAGDERPVRVVAVHHGVVTVETAATHTTAYAIAAGHEPARVIYLRHPKLAGYAAVALPPHTIDEGDAYLVPLPLAAGAPSVLAIEERRPAQRSIELTDARGGDELAAYVDGTSSLPPAIADKLRAAVALRRDAAVLERQSDALRERMGDLASRAAEIRQSLRALDRVANAADLRAKLVASLATAAAETDALAKQLAEHGEAIATAHERLADAIRDLETDAL